MSNTQYFIKDKKVIELLYLKLILGCVFLS